MRILELELQVEILQGQRNTLSAELPLLQVFSLHAWVNIHEHAIYMSSENASNRVVYLFARLQGRCAELQTQRNELSVMMLEMEHQGLLKDGMLGFFNLFQQQSMLSCSRSTN